MEIVWKNYVLGKKRIHFTIYQNEINGFNTLEAKKIISLLSLKHNYQGTIIVNQQELQSKEINQYKKKIGIVKEHLEEFYQTRVYELMYYEIRNKALSLKNPKKKMLDSLKIVGLKTDYLNRTINSLSSSEKKCIQLAITLLSNPDVIVLEEPFKQLDMKNEKKLWMLLQKIKEQYQKTIVFISKDSNILYQYTNHLIIERKDQIIMEGLTNDIYQKVDFLMKNAIEIPNIVEITYLARTKKNIKIDYHKDIRDIIKDIYKHI